MKKLDWYILRQLFLAFITCMLIFTVIAVAVDSSEKTDDFVKSGLTGRQIIRQYYIGFVPYIWGMLYPLFVFIGVIYSTSRMAMRTEIIAILATGTTYNRWLRTYLAGGLFFAVVLWFAARYYIPAANDLRSTFQARYIDGKSPDELAKPAAYYMRTDSNTYIGLKYFDTSSRMGNNFFLNRIKGRDLEFNLRADMIQWDSAARKWRLRNVTTRTVGPMGETIGQQAEMLMDLHLQPADLRRDQYIKDKLTTPELARYIAAEELRGNEGVNTLKVEQYRRTATSYSVVLLTLIGAILAGRKTRGGSGVHLALGIIISVVFIMFDRFSTVFSVKGNLPPLLAAWVPNLLFTFIAIYLYRKAPK
ncbi:LptF/LptG family permease [Flaviaesturariibacter aridisoli]|uniref:YjgP/YjgQ family permease n=1 Tax=Flaviaesturariibacter aridisoli TaxID=2545761 RepID=A0A4R4E2E1_9BACT|nr:LptF/LptG family permease [Flaviaesturariibacter aridisoli]TCZ69578.1 YjgP/YjgQ family permease [Flaviaesturariibacter aridisoli]